MNAIVAFVDGVVSAVLGYVVAAIVPSFLTVFYALNSPWYVPVLYVAFIVIALAAEVINMVVGSVAYSVGFLYGSYVVGDWLAFGLVLTLTVVVLYIKAGG